MSGLVLLFPGRPLKPALKISGENRRRFYFEAFRRRERGNAEREPPAEILSERSESKDLLEPLCGREPDVVEREPAGEILSERSESKDLLVSEATPSGSPLPKS